MLEKIALGTAQLQGPYGIIDNDIVLNINEFEKTIKLAKENNIFTIDTAQGYGDAEKNLGNTNLIDFKIITKFNLGLNKVDIEREIFDQVKTSLKNLKLNKLYAVLIHNPEIMLNPKFQQAAGILKKLQDQGYFSKIGYSVYSPDEAERCLQFFKPDIIQFPYNILDRRFEISGWITRFKKEKIECHSRSIFLQGLLLANKNKINKKFSRWNNIFEEWNLWLKKNKISATQAAVNFVFSNLELDNIIVGVKNSDQFETFIKNVNCLSCLYPSNTFSEDEDLLNPTKWNLT